MKSFEKRNQTFCASNQISISDQTRRCIDQGTLENIDMSLFVCGTIIQRSQLVYTSCSSSVTRALAL